MGGYCVESSPEVAGCRTRITLGPKSDALWAILRGKLGNGEHIFLEANKHKENNIHMIYIIITMLTENKQKTKQKQNQKQKPKKKQKKQKKKTLYKI